MWRDAGTHWVQPGSPLWGRMPSRMGFFGTGGTAWLEVLQHEVNKLLLHCRVLQRGLLHPVKSRTISSLGCWVGGSAVSYYYCSSYSAALRHITRADAKHHGRGLFSAVWVSVLHEHVVENLHCDPICANDHHDQRKHQTVSLKSWALIIYLTIVTHIV